MSRAASQSPYKCAVRYNGEHERPWFFSLRTNGLVAGIDDDLFIVQPKTVGLKWHDWLPLDDRTMLIFNRAIASVKQSQQAGKVAIVRRE